MWIRWAWTAALLAAAGCTTSEAIRRPDGTTEYLVGCGSGTGWNMCYARANELCPTGYETLSESGGINRKELRISCPGARSSRATSN